MRLPGCVRAILVEEDGLNVSDVRFAEECSQRVPVLLVASDVRHVAHALACNHLEYALLEFAERQGLTARALARAPSYLDVRLVRFACAHASLEFRQPWSRGKPEFVQPI